jgi:GMP synthase-like glutamine amidotransferase
MPSCLVIQHVSPERPYAIGDSLADGGVTVDLRRVFAGDPLPDDLSGHDGLVVMGGPASANLDDGFPTRRAEIALLAEGVQRQVPVLGVCLGAQLLAIATGGSAFPGDAGPEIGWGPVTLAPAAADDPLLGSAGTTTLEVLHWHGDTFRLHPDAVVLASNDRYANQAFCVGSRAWGLQFHVEVDGPGVQAMVAAFGDEAKVNDDGPAGILDRAPAVLAALTPVRDRFVGAFVELIGLPAPLA